MQRGTRLIHHRLSMDSATGGVSIPIHQSVVFAQESLDQPGEYEYTRSGNPTRRALEEAIAELEGGNYGFAFASGMAAITAALSLFSSGDHLLVSRDIYGGTYRALAEVFPRFGLEITFVDTTNLETVAAQIRPSTKGLYLETPSNPLMKITDLARAAALAREHGLITIADNTFMTPYLQRPLELGIDIVVHSATKYLGGHSDCLAGLAVTRDAGLARELTLLQNTLGTVLAPHECWLILRGIKTLKVRLLQQQRTATVLAEWLRKHPQVKAVYYPGLEGHPGRETHFRQAGGGGGVLSFRLATPELARQVINNVRLPVIGSSLGAVESIISLPATMSHGSLPGELKRELGITPDLVRLSVGLEEAEDLQADLEQALDSPRGPVASESRV